MLETIYQRQGTPVTLCSGHCLAPGYVMQALLNDKLHRDVILSFLIMHFCSIIQVKTTYLKLQNEMGLNVMLQLLETSIARDIEMYNDKQKQIILNRPVSISF